MNWKTLLLLIFGLCIYNLIGGIAFHFIEQPNETSLASTETSRFTDFVNSYSCVNSSVLETFVVAVIQAYDSGVLSAGNTTSPTNWDMASALFFSFTVISTIGYGHISPATPGGQAFCVIFAIIGIPAMGVTLVNIGLKLNIIYGKMERAKNCCSNRKVDRVLKYVLFHTLFFGLMILLPSLMFTLVEGWTFGNSLYYAVISLTTVGFGDFVAGVADVNLRVLYRLILLLWLVIGLSWVALMISTMQDILGEYTGKVDEKIEDRKKKKAGEDKDDDEKEKKDADGSRATELRPISASSVCEVSVWSDPAHQPQPLHY